jgi:hypothetical protein
MERLLAVSHEHTLPEVVEKQLLRLSAGVVLAAPCSCVLQLTVRTFSGTTGWQWPVNCEHHPQVKAVQT